MKHFIILEKSDALKPLKQTWFQQRKGKQVAMHRKTQREAYSESQKIAQDYLGKQGFTTKHYTADNGVPLTQHKKGGVEVSIIKEAEGMHRVTVHGPGGWRYLGSHDIKSIENAIKEVKE